jgi:hypothetical protein
MGTANLCGKKNLLSVPEKDVEDHEGEQSVGVFYAFPRHRCAATSQAELSAS